MEESVSLNNETGSILLKEYNDLLREVHHLGEGQLFSGIDEQMTHSVDENKLLTDDQAILLQCELNAVKIELEKNQLFQHVCREMDQRSVKSDSAIVELENVISRKENIVETMRKVLTQTLQLYNGRNKIVEGMQIRNDELKLQHAQADAKIRALTNQLETNNQISDPNCDVVCAIKRSLGEAFKNDIRFELKSFSNTLIYFVMYIRAVVNDDDKFPAKNNNNNDKNSNMMATTTNDTNWNDIPLKCVLTKDGDGCFGMKYLFFGQLPVNIDQLQSTPFPIPMLVDLVGRYQQNIDH